MYCLCRIVYFLHKTGLSVDVIISNPMKDINPYIPGKEKQSATTRRGLKFLNSYMTVSNENRIQIGHQLEDLIKSCNFGGLECNVDHRY